MANDLAADSELFIHVDGPKVSASEEVRAKNAAVKALIRQKQWCGKVHFIEPAENRTMPVALVDTVTKLVRNFGKIIVLEDDLVISRGFLRYMNEALELYADREEVMTVEGYLYPVGEIATETFFLRFVSSWGWGTWARAWNRFNPSAESLLEQIPRHRRRAFNLGNSYDFFAMLNKCATGTWKYWDIRWYASVFVSGGLCLYPRKSMVRNIGHDSSGMHCAQDEMYLTQEIEEEVRVVVQDRVENRGVRNRVIMFLWSKRASSFTSAVFAKLQKVWRRGLNSTRA